MRLGKRLAEFKTELSGSFRCQTFLAFAASFSMLGGFVSLLGWVIDQPVLTDWFGVGVSIQPNTAILTFLTGLTLWLGMLRLRRVALALGAALFCAGWVSLAQNVFKFDLGISHQLTFGRTWGSALVFRPGITGPPASLAILLCGLGTMLWQRWNQPQTKPRRWVSILGLIVTVLMFFPLLGYAYNADHFYAIPEITAISLQAALMLFMCGVALVLAVPD